MPSKKPARAPDSSRGAAAVKGTSREAALPPGSALTLKVTLLEVEPPVWRRIAVPGDKTLPELNRVLQTVMGWTEDHVHLFDDGERQYGPLDSELTDVEDESGVTVEKLLHRPEAHLLWEYDALGDSWEHLLELERIGPPAAGEEVPRCLDGARACPPEDIGGAPGYEDFVEAIADPTHGEHEEMLARVKGRFDLEAFDVDAVNAALSGLRRA